MSKSFKRMNINKSNYMYYDTVVVDQYAGQLVYLSLVDNSVELKKAQSEVNRVNSIYIEEARSYVSTNGSKYNTDLRKQSNSEFAHLLVNKKDSVETLKEGEQENELLTAYIYSVDNLDIDNRIYDKLYTHTSIPLIEEWMQYIKEKMLEHNYLRTLKMYTVHDTVPFNAYKLQITKNQLLGLVQDGLRTKAININNADNTSDLMGFIDGLDSYLNIFGDTLARRIQQSFEPKFDPQVQEYSDYVNNYDDACFYGGIELYNAQKATIQAAVNNLDENNVTYVIGEMGCGNVYIK